MELGVLRIRQYQNWFAKSQSGNFDVEHATHYGSLVEADEDTIRALIGTNWRITTHEILTL